MQTSSSYLQGVTHFISIVISTTIGWGIGKQTIAQATASKQEGVPCISEKMNTAQPNLEFI